MKRAAGWLHVAAAFVVLVVWQFFRAISRRGVLRAPVICVALLLALAIVGLECLRRWRFP